MCRGIWDSRMEEDSRSGGRDRLAALPVEGCCCGRLGVSGWVGAQGRAAGQGRELQQPAPRAAKVRSGRTGTGTGPLTGSVTGPVTSDGEVTVCSGLGLLGLGTPFVL